MGRLLGVVSKNLVQNDNLPLPNRDRNSLSRVTVDSSDTGSNAVRRFVNKFFRTNQSYSKTLIDGDNLYSVQYYAQGLYNVYEIPLNELKDVKTSGGHAIIVEESDGYRTQLDTCRPSNAVYDDIMKCPEIRSRFGSKIASKTLN
jgi:hypothetical protein